MTGEQVGYVCVSSLEQNVEHQLDQIKVNRLFTDKASGKNADQPQLKALLAFVRQSDTVTVHSMDRLARNLDDLRRLVRNLTQRSVNTQYMKENLIFTSEGSPRANLLLSVLNTLLNLREH